MLPRLSVAALLTSFALFACGGKTTGEAKGPESDPWAGYKGTYATPGGASGSPATRLKAGQAAAKEEAPAEVADETPAPASEPTPAPGVAAKGKKAKAAAPAPKAAAAPKKKK